MNAPGGSNATGVTRSTQCKEHTEGERSLSASLGRKEVDEIRAIVACPQGTCLKAAETWNLLKQVC